MQDAAAGSEWWDDPDSASDGAIDEPAIDPRTTQPMASIDRHEVEVQPPPSPWSVSPETIRVDTPAWFLRAQQRAAEKNRADSATDDDDADAASVEGDELGDEVDLHGDPASDPDVRLDAVPGPPAPIDPSQVLYDVDADVGSDVAEADRSPVVAASAAAAGPSRKFLDPAVASSYQEPIPPPDVVAGALGLFGAALLAIGSFLIWARSTGIVEATVNGLTGSNGWGTLGCGMVIAFGSALVLTGRRSAVVGGAMLVASLAAVYLCGFSAVDIVSTSGELPEILAGAGVERGTAEAVTLELAPGFAVVAAGAAVSLLAGAIAFARRV